MGDFSYNIFIWITAIIILIAFSIYFWYKMSKKEIISQRRINLGLGAFLFLYAMTRISFLVSDYAEIILEDLLLQDIFWRIAATVGLVGFTILIFVIERYILENKSKFIFTVIGIITIVISVVGGPEIGRIAISYGTATMGIILIILYSYLSIKSSGYVRKRSLEALFGILLLYIGIILDSNLGVSIIQSMIPTVSSVLLRSIGGGLLISGVILFGLSYIRSEE